MSSNKAPSNFVQFIRLKDLYYNGELTQADIAAVYGISTKLAKKWLVDYKDKTLKDDEEDFSLKTLEEKLVKIQEYKSQGEIQREVARKMCISINFVQKYWNVSMGSESNEEN